MDEYLHIELVLHEAPLSFPGKTSCKPPYVNIYPIETPGGKRNLNMNINAQQVIHIKQFKFILNLIC